MAKIKFASKTQNSLIAPSRVSAAKQKSAAKSDENCLSLTFIEFKITLLLVFVTEKSRQQTLYFFYGHIFLGEYVI